MTAAAQSHGSRRPTPEGHPEEPIIQVDGLTRRFGDFTAVDRVAFQVSPGEIFGYLGANGAGKTTTIRMLCGLLAPSDGQATVAGHDVARSPGRVKRAIGYMSQRFSLYQDLTVEENLRFFSGAYRLRGRRRRERIEAALELASLGDQRGQLTRNLPGGIRQRLALASALLHEPRVLYLDEPTAGVDPVSRRAFWRVIRQLAAEGTTLFVTTHHLDEAEYCDRVGLMVDGRLVALDTPAGLTERHVPGEIHAVSGLSARELSQALQGRDEVLAIKPFGARVHVRATGALADEQGLADLLSEKGLSPQAIEPVEPTLEDVFLELVERESNGGGEGAESKVAPRGEAPGVADEDDRAGDEDDRAGDEDDRGADEDDRAGDEDDRGADDADGAGDEDDRAADEDDRAADEDDRGADEDDRGESA
jgi:ABC-2 type transport system ATP-binding protein